MAAPAKSSLLIALGGLKKPKGAPGSDVGEDDDMPMEDEAPPASSEVKSMAVSDVMSAVNSGDATALEDALTRFVGACRDEGYEK